MIPDSIRRHIRQSLGQDIISAQQVSGGSINSAAKVVLDDDRACFLKWNRSADPDMFAKEEKGLQLLKSAGTDIRIPQAFMTGKIDNMGFLLQEFITEGGANHNSAEQFGQALAVLHQQHKEKFGLDHDNYIGKLPQSNRWHESWVNFFVEERMQPQLKMATDAGKLGSDTVAHFELMYKQLPNIFPNEQPGLLHGDLWGGNYFFDANGQATIYDPAVYYGHREIELAFTYLFGGFPGAFYNAYDEAYPMASGFNQRKDVYNLYPLLVHTNLFGGSYARQVEGIVKRFQ